MNKKQYWGFGDWGLGIGDWGLGIRPNPQSPILYQNNNNVLILNGLILK